MRLMLFLSRRKRLRISLSSFWFIRFLSSGGVLCRDRIVPPSRPGGKGALIRFFLCFALTVPPHPLARLTKKGPTLSDEAFSTVHCSTSWNLQVQIFFQSILMHKEYLFRLFFYQPLHFWNVYPRIFSVSFVRSSKSPSASHKNVFRIMEYAPDKFCVTQ